MAAGAQVYEMDNQRSLYSRERTDDCNKRGHRRNDREAASVEENQWDAESNLVSADWVGLPGSAAGSGDK